MKKPKGMSRELYDLLIRQGKEDKIVSFMQSGMTHGYSSVKAQVRRKTAHCLSGPTGDGSMDTRTSTACPPEPTAKLLPSNLSSPRDLSHTRSEVWTSVAKPSAF